MGFDMIKSSLGRIK